MISSEYKEILMMIEQHSWRINSLISLIKHNESFYSKFRNTEQSDKANNENKKYLEQIKNLNSNLKGEFNKLIKLDENDI